MCESEGSLRIVATYARVGCLSPARHRPAHSGARRPPARLVADATLARQQLGWTPQFPELDTLVAHAWSWEQKVAAGTL